MDMFVFFLCVYDFFQKSSVVVAWGHILLFLIYIPPSILNDSIAG
jgi:hypothetical protein